MDTIGTDSAAQSAIDIIQQHVFFRPKEDQGWQSKPELPTAQEILAPQSDNDELPHNPVDVPWSSKDDYLAAQYSILRCEATEGLRYSVRSVAEHRRREPMMENEYTNIYTQVYVKEYIMTTIGPLARVSFSTERSQFRIQWQQSKRLQPGKIVALSPKSDNFRSICKIATVAQRPYRDGLDQDPPLVDLQWASPEDAVLDPNLEMIMVESLHGYFESARHALVGLQHAARTDSPIDKYLTGACNEDNHPGFLKEDPIMDISSLASRGTSDDNEAVDELRTYDIVNSNVPDLKDLTSLDESQLLGLHRVISKELAIVQGPPGTGKTYTSVEALKAMIASRRRHRGPPILVAAQTNHALDQLLLHCLNAGANVLRMGGRTQNELIKACTLYELRQKCQVPADRKCGSIDQQRRGNTRKIQELVDSLFGDRLLDPNALLEFDIITPAQHESLGGDEAMETHDAVNLRGPFALWLGDSLIQAKVRQDRHRTETELNEAEARRNLPEFECEDDEDLENIADDEEDLCRFRGEVITLKHVWTGKDPANLASWDRAVRRALRTDDLYTIDRDLRGAVYQYFQARLLEVMAPKFAALLAENAELCKKRKAFKFLGNTQLVRNLRIDIVGCTTTGLTKYRGCLAAMEPQSLLIEEAAETREQNIVSALYPSVQQLILVGDHKQLAPKCDIARLGDEPYNLNVSLFQRLVNLDMQFVMLKQQRRMKPELRHILNPFYPELFDHPSVMSINNRPNVPGMGGRNLWLFDHTWPEETNIDFSKFNEAEAEMITQFFAYLVANGTPADKITVLTFYKGQRKILLSKLKRHPSLMGSVFNVCTVDSYQGEENDVILLSLVRSPQSDRNYAVGFLEDERRAVVAISRARRGFYVFGNVDNVLKAHQVSYDLWYKICSGFAQQARLNRERGLPLVCQPHGREIWVKDLDDWGDNTGGCDLRCEQTRHCGHPCTLRCHATAHENLACSEPCREKLACGHGCQKLCGQSCFCDCKAFEEIHRQTQAERQHLSLEQNLLRMGAEPTEMLMASLNQRNAARQPPKPSPALPAPHGSQVQGKSAKGRKGKKTPKTTTSAKVPKAINSAQVAQTAAQWGQFVGNIAQHDAQLQVQKLSAVNQQAPAMVIQDVYQPTALVNGQRAGGGARMVQQVQVTYSQVAAGHSNGNGQAVSGSTRVTELEAGIANLSMTNGSASYNQARQLMTPSENGASTPAAANNPPGLASEVNGGSRPGGKSSTKTGGEHHLPVQQPSIQEAPLQHHPVQEPLVQLAPDQPTTSASEPPRSEPLDLLSDDWDESTTSEGSNGALGTLSGHQITPHLLAQFGALVPSPASSVRNGVLSNGVSSSSVAASVQSDLGQSELGQMKQPMDGADDEEEEDLIEL